MFYKILEFLHKNSYLYPDFELSNRVFEISFFRVRFDELLLEGMYLKKLDFLEKSNFRFFRKNGLGYGLVLALKKIPLQMGIKSAWKMLI